MTSTSAVLTLASFQSIASSSVPLGCILAYNNTRLSGCKRSDFLSGTGCSASCQRSIQSVESTLQLVCGGGDVDVPSGSVLASAMQGNLLNTLCGNGLQQSSSSSRTVVTTTTTTRPRESNAPIMSTISSPQSTTTSAAATTTVPAPTPNLPPPPRPDTESPRETNAPDPEPVPAPPAPERGGGSPFDVQVAGASSTAISRLLLMSWTCVLLLLMR